MPKIVLAILLFFLSGRALGQDYFVFIASDHRQPFYVRIDSQLYASSPEGHLLLAPLKDSNYTLTIGLPGDISSEKRYALSVRGKDREFALRRRDDGNWRLYDELGKNWVEAEGKERSGEVGSAGIKKDDAFSRMMAGVVHDTAVLYNTFATEQVLKDSPVVKGPRADSSTAKGPPVEHGSVVKALPTADSPAAKPPVAGSSAVKTLPTADGLPVHPEGKPGSGVVKLSEKKYARSLRLVYVDRNDTVVVIIPKDTVAAAKNTRTHSAEIGQVRPADSTLVHRVDSPRALSKDAALYRQPDSSHTRSKDATLSRQSDSSHTRSKEATLIRQLDSSRALSHAVDTPFAAHSTGSRAVLIPRANSIDTSRQAAKVITYINSDCHNFATDYDVDRLRVKMLDAANDEDRIAAARKVFKTKCFYTPQVRALSEVFSSDAGKFRFFQAAWPFAADEHFQELSAVLSDPTYIAEFKTMTGGRP